METKTIGEILPKSDRAFWVVFHEIMGGRYILPLTFWNYPDAKIYAERFANLSGETFIADSRDCSSYSCNGRIIEQNGNAIVLPV